MNQRRVLAFLVAGCLILSFSLIWAEKAEKAEKTEKKQDAEKAKGQLSLSELTTKKTPPGRRVKPCVVFRKKANQLVVFGGWLETLTPKGDLWTLDLKTNEWSRLQPKNGDPKKVGLTIGLYDEKRDRLVVLFLKVTEGIETQWYSFEKNEWHTVPPAGDFPKRFPITSPVYDPKSDAMVFFGGSAWENPDSTRYRMIYYNDTYSLSLKDLKWKKLETKGEAPSARDRHIQIYDPKSGSLVIYGGMGTDKTGANEVLGDVHRLDLKTLEWKLIETKGDTVGPRCRHLAFYDPTEHSVFCFGGTALFEKYYLEVLQLDLETYTWTRPRTKAPVTLQLADAGAVWDSVSKRGLVFGGIQPGSMMMNSVWEIVEE